MYNRDINLLPVDGVVNYYGSIIPASESDQYLATLTRTISWENDKIHIFGKHIITKREMAWYGDRAFEYTYSGITKTALPWTTELIELKRLAENISGESFNSCLLNFYHSGNEGMGWHSDAEPVLLKNGAIASLSFGAKRKFILKHKQLKQTISVLLEHGSLLIMKGSTQQYWLHSLPPSKRITMPRINLTFRTIVA
jgi:alkylated DNA repair dioxygenase AlkB